MGNDLDRDAVISALRHLAAALGRPPERLDLQREAHWAVLRWFGSLARARDAAGLAAPDRNVKWSQQRVLAELRRVSRAGLVITRRNLAAAARHDLIGAIALHVGSLVRARRLARVPGPTYQPHVRQRWDEDRVVSEIRRLRRGGQSLAMANAPSRLLKAATYYFGGWRAAIEAAGLDYDQVRLVREPYTDDELLARLRDLAKRKPRFTAGELSHLPWREALVKHFGSIDVALKRAGIVDWPVRLREAALSRGNVLAALRKRRRAGESTYMRAVMLADHHLFHSVLVHFSSWPSALAAAKLDSDSPSETNMTWTNESLLAAIVARHRRGDSLKPADVRREDSQLFHSAHVRFNGFTAACRAAGVPTPWALIRWTPEVIVAELKRLAGGRGRISVDEAGNKLTSACQRHFGSFTAACRAAGLSTDHGAAYATRFKGKRKGTPRRTVASRANRAAVRR